MADQINPSTLPKSNGDPNHTAATKVVEPSTHSLENIPASGVSTQAPFLITNTLTDNRYRTLHLSKPFPLVLEVGESSYICTLIYFH